MLLLLLLVLAVPAFAGTGEEPLPVLAEGSRVRLTLLARDSEKILGSVLALPPDSLVLAQEDSSRLAVSRLDVKKLEISGGMRSNSTRGAWIGGLVGGIALGLAVASVASEEGESSAAPIFVVLGGAAGALGGAGIGALIGGASHRERWVEVPKE